MLMAFCHILWWLFLLVPLKAQKEQKPPDIITTLPVDTVGCFNGLSLFHCGSSRSDVLVRDWVINGESITDEEKENRGILINGSELTILGLPINDGILVGCTVTVSTPQVYSKTKSAYFFVKEIPPVNVSIHFPESSQMIIELKESTCVPVNHTYLIKVTDELNVTRMFNTTDLSYATDVIPCGKLYNISVEVKDSLTNNRSIPTHEIITTPRQEQLIIFNEYSVVCNTQDQTTETSCFFTFGFKIIAPSNHVCLFHIDAHVMNSRPSFDSNLLDKKELNILRRIIQFDQITQKFQGTPNFLSDEEKDSIKSNITSISSFDVQDFYLHTLPDGLLDFECIFATGSRANGCLIEIITSDSTLDFSISRYTLNITRIRGQDIASKAFSIQDGYYDINIYDIMDDKVYNVESVIKKGVFIGMNSSRIEPSSTSFAPPSITSNDTATVDQGNGGSWTDKIIIGAVVFFFILIFICIIIIILVALRCKGHKRQDNDPEKLKKSTQCTCMSRKELELSTLETSKDSNSPSQLVTSYEGNIKIPLSSSRHFSSHQYISNHEIDHCISSMESSRDNYGISRVCCGSLVLAKPSLEIASCSTLEDQTLISEYRCTSKTIDQYNPRLLVNVFNSNNYPSLLQCPVEDMIDVNSNVQVSDEQSLVHGVPEEEAVNEQVILEDESFLTEASSVSSDHIGHSQILVNHDQNSIRKKRESSSKNSPPFPKDDKNDSWSSNLHLLPLLVFVRNCFIQDNLLFDKEAYQHIHDKSVVSTEFGFLKWISIIMAEMWSQAFEHVSQSVSACVHINNENCNDCSVFGIPVRDIPYEDFNKYKARLTFVPSVLNLLMLGDANFLLKETLELTSWLSWLVNDIITTVSHTVVYWWDYTVKEQPKSSGTVHGIALDEVFVDAKHSVWSGQSFVYSAFYVMLTHMIMMMKSFGYKAKSCIAKVY